jgi:glycogen operon protein
MTAEDWGVGFAKSLAVFLNGSAISELGAHGERVVDDSFLMLFNAHHGELDFAIPGVEYGEAWEAVLDTADTDVGGRSPYRPGEKIRMIGRSLLVLRQC